MIKVWEIAEALAWGKRHISQFESENFSLDIDWILASILDCKRIYLYAHSQQKLTQEESKKFFAAVERRAKGEPVAHITGSQSFYGRKFTVTSDVLIPRPETERLVEAIFNKYSAKSELNILDLGSGSGCISVSLSLELKDAAVEAWDISDRALEVARLNNERLGSKVKFYQKDMTKASDWESESTKFDIIASNPPYISPTEYEVLPQSVKQYEPKSSLFADEEGVSFYVSIAKYAPSRMKKGATLFLEVGYRQASKVTAILESYGFKNCQILKDYSGHDRVVIAEWL